MELTHTATREGRLSSFLREELGLSTGLMNRLKWADKLFVNGVARHADHLVRPGDVITLPMEEEVPDYPGEFGPLRVIYEDAHLLAVDKPAGMLIHPSRSQFTGTLANRVIGYYQQTGQASAFHPLTRLDRDTFGLVLLAKNAHIHARLNDLHARGLVQKLYHGLVFGGPKAEAGRIDAPIARKPLPSLLREIREDGKPSVTEFQVLARGPRTSKLALHPITGRTHQLRLHCAYAGFPILGDPQYGNDGSRALSANLGLGSQCLCARELQLLHPVTGAPLLLTSQMEVSDFRELP